MAGKGGKGTSRNGRDSRAKRLGVKLMAGQVTQIGSVIIKQRGSKFLAGINVRRGHDDTLYAVAAGKVQFRTIRKKRFNGLSRRATEVFVSSA